MPCSSESRIKWEYSNGEIVMRPRWELIREAFKSPIENALSLEVAIKSYNPSYASVWNFANLQYFDDHAGFFETILPKIIEIALSLPDLVQTSIPLLKQGMNRAISMTQRQAACLLANAFLCTFPRRNTQKEHSEFSNYPDINFSWLYGASGRNVIEKLKCIANYFERVLSNEMPSNVITFQRHCIQPPSDWEASDEKISTIKLFISSNGTIEEARGTLQVDFANRFVGGGVLGRGCVQEEIRFVINPEMLVSKLFTECLDKLETLVMIGCEQFSMYRGYASSFEFAGDIIDDTPLDKCRRKKCRVVAIDATNYSYQRRQQYEKSSISRDLNKAFCGFARKDIAESIPVASGLWGCGAFGGDPIRSILIQLMACAVNQRNLTIFTFGNDQVRMQAQSIYETSCAKGITVGQLYSILGEFGSSYRTMELAEFVQTECEKVLKPEEPRDSRSTFKKYSPHICASIATITLLSLATFFYFKSFRKSC